MDRPSTYRLRIRGRLDPAWAAWFDAVELTVGADGDTTLIAHVADQAALHGLLGRVRDLGLTLVSVATIDLKGRES